MNNHITSEQIVERLEENGLGYGVLELQDGATAILSQRGGRIFGPFLSPGDESLFWMNAAFTQAAKFVEFLESGSWNLGGDRMWIAPEIQYSVRDRADYWGTIAEPPQIDPGMYTLESMGGGQWRLFEAMTLDAYNLATGQKSLMLERLIRPVDDPLRFVSVYESLLHGVRYVGYEQTVTLREGKHDDILSEAWSLVQLNPGGRLLIPASPYVELTDYYEPIDASLYTRHPNHLSVDITGTRQYKIGIKAAHTFGRLGYVNRRDGGEAYLVVRNYFNDPSLPYAEEPDKPVGCRGHSIHVYNDDGLFGGFGELECNLPTIGGETGRSSSTDHLGLWSYVGPEDKINEIALHLLGIQPFA
jgi:hypothetical protein